MANTDDTAIPDDKIWSSELGTVHCCLSFASKKGNTGSVVKNLTDIASSNYWVEIKGVEEAAIIALKRALGALNTHLASNIFLVGNAVTLAGIVISYCSALVCVFDKLHSQELDIEQLQAELATAVRGNDILICEVQHAVDNLSNMNHKLKDLELQGRRMREDGFVLAHC
ncbi:hypothetical protein POM88_022608 [Heracleum sosnowskyi]|uniref:Uncharacterized protein n=1 Tax=Heracleum sosnowskyi TaxID=360622 RepID=A0AAD8MUZ4_9APIA|nr:hypothetical protein POM88_022608 [Heracleum sosnowskyi]